MIKDFRVKEVNFSLERNGLRPVKSVRELESSLSGTAYTPVREKARSVSGATARVQFAIDEEQ